MVGSKKNYGAAGVGSCRGTTYGARGEISARKTASKPSYLSSSCYELFVEIIYLPMMIVHVTMTFLFVAKYRR